MAQAQLGIRPSSGQQRRAAIGTDKASTHQLKELVFVPEGFNAADLCAKVRRNAATLRILKVRHCAQVNDTILAEMAPHCGQLRELDLAGCRQVSDEAVAKFVSNCHKLTKASFAGCVNIQSLTLSALAETCLALRELDLTLCPQVDASMVSGVQQQCPGLVRLTPGFQRYSSAGGEDVA